MRTIERHLQQCPNRIEDWATRNDFKFHTQKLGTFISLNNGKYTLIQVSIYIYVSQIPVVAESKFLGVIFDRELSPIPHIKICES